MLVLSLQLYEIKYADSNGDSFIKSESQNRSLLFAIIDEFLNLKYSPISLLKSCNIDLLLKIHV